MITNDEQFAVVKAQMERLERSLRSLRQTTSPIHPAKFTLMAEPIVEDLTELRAQVDAYLGVTATREADASMVLSLEGPGVRLGDTRGSVVTRTVESVRKGVAGIIAALHSQLNATRHNADRPTWVNELSDFPIAQLAPGSVRIVLGVPTTTDLFSESQHELLRDAIRYLSDAAAASESASTLTEHVRTVPEPIQGAVLLALRELAPSRESEVESVVFGSRFARQGSPARVTRYTRTNVTATMKSLGTPQSSGNVEDPYVFLEGDIRGVDLDGSTFTLRNTSAGGNDWTCQFEEQFVDDVVSLLGARVSVVGEKIRSKQPRVDVLAVTPIDKSDEEATTGSDV